MASLSFLLALFVFAIHSSTVQSIQPGGVPLFVSSNSSSTSSSPSFTSKAAAVGAVSGSLRFTLVTDEAPWSARAIGAVELFTRQLTFTPVGATRPTTYQPNSFVLHGGSGALNDV